MSNSTFSVLISCTISGGTGATSCTSPASVPVDPGHYLQVRVTSNGADRRWRVTFRY